LKKKNNDDQLESKKSKEKKSILKRLRHCEERYSGVGNRKNKKALNLGCTESHTGNCGQGTQTWNEYLL